LRKRR